MARLTPWFFGIFMLAALLHLAWAGLLIDGDDPLGATPLHTIGALVTNRYALIAILVGISALALWSLVWPIRSRWGIVAMIPQQVLMLLSGGGAVKSIVESAYADGVIRPQGFIGADQLLVVLLAIIHTLALLWITVMEARHG